MSIFSVEVAKAGSAVTVTALVALLVCLIPTTIGALLSAIGVAGMSRMMQANVIATSGRAVEAAGDVDVLLMDKTGTITLGNRQASAFVPAKGVTEQAAGRCRRSSPRWPTRRPRAAASPCSPSRSSISASGDMSAQKTTFVPFTAQTRMSGVDIAGSSDGSGAATAQGCGSRRSAGMSSRSAEAFPAALSRRPPTTWPAEAARRSSSADGAAKCSVSSSSRTSSRAASRNASPNCGAWASRP